MYSHKGLSIRLFLGIEITIQLRYKDSYSIFPPFPLQTAHWSFPVPKALFSFKKIFIKQKKPCPDRSPDELANRDSMIYCIELFWEPWWTDVSSLNQLRNGHSIQLSLSLSIRLGLNICDDSWLPLTAPSTASSPASCCKLWCFH